MLLVDGSSKATRGVGWNKQRSVTVFRMKHAHERRGKFPSATAPLTSNSPLKGKTLATAIKCRLSKVVYHQRTVPATNWRLSGPRVGTGSTKNRG